MTPPRLSPELVRTMAGALLSALVGVAGGTWVARGAWADIEHDVVDARRVADDAAAAGALLAPRVTVLETWRAVSDERWGHVVQLLEELRRDLKELKGR